MGTIFVCCRPAQEDEQQKTIVRRSSAKSIIPQQKSSISDSSPFNSIIYKQQNNITNTQNRHPSEYARISLVVGEESLPTFQPKTVLKDSMRYSYLPCSFGAGETEDGAIMANIVIENNQISEALTIKNSFRDSE